MTIQEFLLKKGFKQNIDYSVNQNQVTPLIRTTWNESLFCYEEVLAPIPEQSLLEREFEIEQGLQAQALGAKILARVRAINESKDLSPQDFNTLMSDETLARIERLLWTGSLKTAKLLIQGLDNTFFTEEEKEDILDMLANY